MQIFVLKAFNGVVLTLDVDPSDDIVLVKSKIRDIEGIPPRQQRLVNGATELTVGAGTLKEQGVDEHSTLHLVVDWPEIEVWVLVSLFTTAIHAVRVRADDTISKVKALVNIDGEARATTSTGTMIEDDVILADYNIRSHTILFIGYGRRLPAFQGDVPSDRSLKVGYSDLGLQHTCKLMRLMAHEHDTVSKIKSKIVQWWRANAAGRGSQQLDTDDLEVWFEDKELTDDRRTLAECNIQLPNAIRVFGETTGQAWNTAGGALMRPLVAPVEQSLSEVLQLLEDRHTLSAGLLPESIIHLVVDTVMHSVFHIDLSDHEILRVAGRKRLWDSRPLGLDTALAPLEDSRFSAGAQGVGQLAKPIYADDALVMSRGLLAKSSASPVAVESLIVGAIGVGWWLTTFLETYQNHGYVQWLMKLVSRRVAQYDEYEVLAHRIAFAKQLLQAKMHSAIRSYSRPTRQRPHRGGIDAQRAGICTELGVDTAAGDPKCAAIVQH